MLSFFGSNPIAGALSMSSRFAAIGDFVKGELCKAFVRKFVTYIPIARGILAAHLEIIEEAFVVNSECNKFAMHELRLEEKQSCRSVPRILIKEIYTSDVTGNSRILDDSKDASAV